jgi:SAM-dependent methyltransferase
VVQDVLSRRQDYPNLPTNERISFTYQQTIEQALALSVPFLNNGIAATTDSSSTYRLRVLELGIGSDCTSIYRKSYSGAISSIARHVSTNHSPKYSLHITGMDYIDEQVSFDDLLKDGWDFSFVAGDAQDLAKLYPSDTFDVVTCSYLLCSVIDPQGVLQEIYRLLKPNRGVFGFVEHVAVDTEYNNHGHRLLEIQQLALDPLQQAVANNCHLHRYTEQSIQNVFGMDSFVTKERFFVDEMWPVSCQMLGVVRKA